MGLLCLWLRQLTATSRVREAEEPLASYQAEAGHGGSSGGHSLSYLVSVAARHSARWERGSLARAGQEVARAGQEVARDSVVGAVWLAEA